MILGLSQMHSKMVWHDPVAPTTTEEIHSQEKDWMQASLQSGDCENFAQNHPSNQKLFMIFQNIPYAAELVQQNHFFSNMVL